MPNQVILLTFTHLIPIILLFSLAADVWRRNPERAEHRLISISIAMYGLLFTAEYIRHQLPIEYSPAIVTYWFGNTGIMILCLFMHFMARVTRFYKRMPKIIYPTVFYLPLIPVILTILLQQNYMNSSSFEQIGIWIYPEFNQQYLITMTVSNLFHLAVIICLFIAKKYIRSKERLKIINLLILVASFVLIWDCIFGYFRFEGIMPPYSYIYGGMVWLISIGIAMQRFDFLAAHTRRFETLYNMNPAAIVLVNEKGMIESANPSADLLFRKELKGLEFNNLLPVKKRAQWREQLKAQQTSHQPFRDFDTRILLDESLERHVVIDADTMYLEHEPHTLMIIRDVHEEKEAQKMIRFLAYHDTLTKLSNRRYFYEEAASALGEEQRIAIVVIDLDGFKGINDTYGHQTGDDFLVHLAMLLDLKTEEIGLASRVGGDEFYLLLPFETAGEVHSFMQYLLEMFEQHPFQQGDVVIPIRSSIGISFAPDHGRELDLLIQKADQAMYDIKRNGKNDYKIYDGTDSQESWSI